MTTGISRFALMGAGGYVAERHMRAIRDTGNQLVAAVDPCDSVGVMDAYFPDAYFFTETERFERHLEKLRRRDDSSKVDYISICTPNYLHDAHIRLALRQGAHAICEKPLVINPWNLDALQETERETGMRVYTVLQLRLIPELMAIHRRVLNSPPLGRIPVDIAYVTRRGRWYQRSWKGKEEKSGGLAMNIGIHLFDMALWLFGPVEGAEVHLRQRDRMSGILVLKHAEVRWFLSVNEADLSQDTKANHKCSYRAITMGDEHIEFSTGFTDLHTQVYCEILANRGWGIEEARPAIDLVYRLRQSPALGLQSCSHPLAQRTV
jgi:UDP-N-acetyl-2-amino-2-deoxyglucuronate dehydrogenase